MRRMRREMDDDDEDEEGDGGEDDVDEYDEDLPAGCARCRRREGLASLRSASPRMSSSSPPTAR